MYVSHPYGSGYHNQGETVTIEGALSEEQQQACFESGWAPGAST
jgi:hypothetical protein